ncbi:MAG: response regulator [Phenylobacterium sp.]
MSTDTNNDQRLRVLLADDHPTNRAVVEVILAIIEADLVSVEDGAQAVAAFKAGVFDVILMDLQMPVMDGLTAIREIRRLEREGGQTRTPILAVTANAMSEHVAASRAAGADDHLAKPVVAETLIEAIYNATDVAAAGLDDQALAS